MRLKAFISSIGCLARIPIALRWIDLSADMGILWGIVVKCGGLWDAADRNLRAIAR